MAAPRTALIQALWCVLALVASGCSIIRQARETPPIPSVQLPEGFHESLYVRDVSENPTVMAFAPDGRLFVADQGGTLWVVKDGKRLDQPFLAVDADYSPLGERGLVGIAFDPEFATNGHVYVYYTANTFPAFTRLSRFTADPQNPDLALGGSEVVLLELDSQLTVFHQGGAIRFGPDGSLFIGTGDNIGGNTSQSLTTTHGKILRINRDGSIPPDNPFFDRTSGIYRSIWAYGLRNAFAFAFQPGTGRMYINDTGQDRMEEIDDGVKGGNYGWPSCEGPCTPPDPRFIEPLFAYGHQIGPQGGCAISGGAFYNPPQPTFPEPFLGRYFFIDFCSTWIKMLIPETGVVTTFASNLAGSNNNSATLASVEVGPDGAIYWINRYRRSIYRIQYSESAAPVVGEDPASQVVAAGDPVQLEVRASGRLPLSYQWQRDGTDIPGADRRIYSFTAAPGSSGRYRCVVTSLSGRAVSAEATVDVVPHPPPNVTILTPSTDNRAGPGSTVDFSATAKDASGKEVPSEKFVWKVEVFHETHTHPLVRETIGSRGSFTIPTASDNSGELFYRLTLEVTDEDGLATTVTRDIQPDLTSIRIESDPPGLTVVVDGLSRRTPTEVRSVRGYVRRIAVLSPQRVGQNTYEFDGWSDGAPPERELSTPPQDVRLIVRFRPIAE